MDRSPIRETGTSDSSRPSPGEFVDVSRRRALEALLEKHDEPLSAAHAFWAKNEARRRRIVLGGRWDALRKLLGMSTAALLIFGVTAHAQTRQEVAAHTLRVLDSSSNLTLHPPCNDCTGPHVVVIGSTPGASTWLTFPPPSPRLRLDGTPLTQRPTIYGQLRRSHK